MILLKGLPPSNELELLGDEMRQVALSDPCLIPEDGAHPKFYQMVGLKYHVALVLELYHAKEKDLPPPPRWHCSVNILHDVASGTDQNFGIPDQAILNCQLWNADDVKDAREIMGYMLGPVILEKTQPIAERAGMMAYHWFTPTSPALVHSLVEER